MTKSTKGTQKQSASSAGDVETVLGHAQEVYGLIKQATANGKTGKKQDPVQLLGALVKTTKGVVDLAIDHRKKYVENRKEKAMLQNLKSDLSSERAIRAEESSLSPLTFQARFQLRGEPQSIVIDTAAPCTVIDTGLLQVVVPDARIEKLSEPVRFVVDGFLFKATAKALFVLEIAGETASVRLLPCTAYVADQLPSPSFRNLLFGSDMLALYGIDLLMSTMQMRINACEGELVPLAWGEQVNRVCSKTG